MTDFHPIFDAAPDPYLVLRATAPFSITAANDAYLRMANTARSAILGRAFLDLAADAAARSLLEKALAAAIATRQPQGVPPLRYHRPPGATATDGVPGGRSRGALLVPINSAGGAVEAVLHRLDPLPPDRETAPAPSGAAGVDPLTDPRTRLEAALHIGDLATGIWEIAPDRVYADSKLAQWFHLPADQAAGGRRLVDYLAPVHPEDAPGLRERIERARRGDVDPEVAFRVRREDGSWRHVIVRTQLERDEHGQPARFVAVPLDVSQLHAATAALTEVRERLELAAEAAEIGTFSWNLRSDELNWSLRCKEHFGVPPDAIMSIERFYERIHPEDRERVRAQVNHSLAGDTPYDVELRSVSPRGEVRWIHAKGRAYRDAAGVPVRFDGITIDISRQKEIESHLLQTEARYRLVVDSLQDYAIFLLDEDGIVTDWNAGAERLLGYTAAEILGQSARIFFTPEDRARGEADKEIATAKRTGRAADDRWHLRKDGSRFFVTGLLAAVTDPQGRRTGLAKIMRDITDREVAAAERERLLESERAARAEAERTSRLKDDFLATLSHELRTPLNAILGWTQVLQEGGLTPAEFAEGLDIIDRNTRVQAQLIEELLDMSRIVSGKLRLQVRPLDLAAAVEAAVESVRTAALARRIRISTHYGHGDILILADRTRLQQVAWNLLFNAIKFTPEGGSVEVTTARNETDVILRVRDTGAGIAPDFLPHVFERFRQADASTTRQHSGLGLGLSIVKQLVDLHGGEVRAESPGLGHGATFTVSIPITARAVEAIPAAPAAPGAPRPDPPRPTADLRGLKVLVVDDEPDSARLASRVLSSLGAEVATAHSVSAGLAAFTAFAPHLVISDIGMPGHDGYELIRRLRALPGGAEVAALALTALAREQDVRGTLAAGFHAHLAKPIEPRALVTAVASLTGRLRPPPA